MIDYTEAWIKRADEILALPSRGNQSVVSMLAESVQFTTSLLTALHGAQSPQLKTFLTGQEAQAKSMPRGLNTTADFQIEHAKGAIRNAKAELQAGLIRNLRIEVSGEVLAELVRLGKDALEGNGPEAKNVSAVLVAAAFEGVMRRMGEELASVTGRPDLQAVITALKNQNILKGGAVGTAQSYLKFRNDSLHADWDKVERPQIQSCVGFLDELLTKHFS
jgi:hypothetical protein